MPPYDLAGKGVQFSCHEGYIFPLRMVRQSRSSRVVFIRLLLPGLLFLQPSSGETPARFVHPGVLHGSSELEFVRGQIASGEEPWFSAWEALVSHRWASLEHRSRAHADVVRGRRGKNNVGMREMMDDSAAAYTHALHWSLSGKRVHADKAIEILNDYGRNLRSIEGHDARLLVGITGIHFVNAAELIAHSQTEWKGIDRERFATMLRKVLYPVIENFHPTANGNWDASMIQTMMAIGVFLDDRSIYQRGVDYFLRGRGNGCLTNYVKPSGQCQESGRDQHHTLMGLGYLTSAAEIARNQGLDLYGAAGNRLAAAFEYCARYGLGYEVPFERFVSIDGRYDHDRISEIGRGWSVPVFELPYRHYHLRRKIEMPFSEQMLRKLRPEKPSVDHKPWSTLMWAQGALPVKRIGLRVDFRTPILGTDKWDWWQARTAQVPGEKPLLVTTMSETGKSVSHDFHDIYQTLSRDNGRTWSKPAIIPSLRRFRQDDGFEVAIGDLWPAWHAKSGVVITTGKTFNFEGGTREIFTREKVSYAVMDPGSGQWGPMKFLAMPEKDHSGALIVAANAGNNQRVDLPDGDILLPVRYQRGVARRNYTSVVVRCGFDGHTLTYREHGSELNIPRDRGLYEPSLTEFEGRYYLTLRSDHSAFVTKGHDGINFDPIREWQFDDGTPLGSYNTQQHWITAGGGLFLVYTRKGANNDHVFRHRAPLFIGQVHPETLRVIRATERILIPENHATLGNSGVCRLNEHESIVTCGEGLLRLGKRRGELNAIHFVKVTAGN